MVCRELPRHLIAIGRRGEDESLAFFSFGTYSYILRTILLPEYYLVRRKYKRKIYLVFYLFSLRRFRSIYPHLPLAALCIGYFCRNVDSCFINHTFILFSRFEDQKHSILGLECTKIEKIILFLHFFAKIFGHMRATPSHLTTLMYLRTPPVGKHSYLAMLERIFPTFPRSYDRKMQPMPPFLPKNTLFLKKNTFFCKKIWSCPFFVVPLHPLSKRKCS